MRDDLEPTAAARRARLSAAPSSRRGSPGDSGLSAGRGSEIGQEVLAHAGVLRRAIPEAECVFLAIGGDPEGHDQAVFANVDAVEDQAHQVQAVERRGLPRRQLRRGLRHEPATHGALARAPTPHRRRHRLEATRVTPRGHAHQHLFYDASVQADRCPPSRRTWGAGPRRHRRAPVADAPPPSGRRAPPRCSRRLRARPGGRSDAHSAARTGPCDPRRASLPTPSAPTERRARIDRFE
jgi:hypothetical protein